MPTRLGNVLKAGEQRAGGRYGLDADVAFPHLYPFLRPPLQAAWDDYTNQLDSAAHLFVTFSIATALSTGLLLPHGDGWWLVVPPVFAALAWLSYRSTIAAARYQARLLAAAFDLHRFDLLTAMHLRLPKDGHDEFDLNQQLNELLLADLPTRASSTRRARFEKGIEIEPWEGYVHSEPTPATTPIEASEPSPVLWEWRIRRGNGERVSREEKPSPTP